MVTGMSSVLWLPFLSDCFHGFVADLKTEVVDFVGVELFVLESALVLPDDCDLLDFLSLGF